MQGVVCSTDVLAAAPPKTSDTHFGLAPVFGQLDLDEPIEVFLQLWAGLRLEAVKETLGIEHLQPLVGRFGAFLWLLKVLQLLQGSFQLAQLLPHRVELSSQILFHHCGCLGHPLLVDVRGFARLSITTQRLSIFRCLRFGGERATRAANHASPSQTMGLPEPITSTGCTYPLHSRVGRPQQCPAGLNQCKPSALGGNLNVCFSFSSSYHIFHLIPLKSQRNFLETWENGL